MFVRESTNPFREKTASERAWGCHETVSGIHNSSVQRRLVIKRHSAPTNVRRASGFKKRRGRRRGEAVYDITNRDLCEQAVVRISS